ncbi:hypothetical protein [Algoriphagus chordae]|nr:hypothetical protein [Algoriphagus chordae]
MKNRPRLLLTLICLVVLFSCERVKPVSLEYDAEFEEIMSGLNFDAGVKEPHLDLSKVFVKSDWDSVIVIKHYSQYSKFARLDLKNKSEIRFILNEMNSTDFHYYLLFIREDQITAYSKMSNYYRICFNESQLFPIIPKSNPEMAIRQVQLDPAFYQLAKIGK